MTAEPIAPQQSLYENDYLEWIETTIAQLKQQNYGAIDWENLIDEIEDMARSEGRSLKNSLVVILTHLLKWQFQPEHRINDWKATIVKHRFHLRDSLEDSPSLKPYFEEVLAECYEDAIELASIETELPAAAFPSGCPYASEEVLETGFLSGLIVTSLLTIAYLRNVPRNFRNELNRCCILR